MTGTNKNIVCIIPARGGSKAIPKKNIKMLGGHPLVTYSIAAAKLSSLIENVIVTTDSEEIAEICRNYGADVPFLRPAEISRDNSVDIEFLQHYIDYCISVNVEPPEYMVHFSPTVPFREPIQIDKGITEIIENPEATSLRSVYLSGTSPYKVFNMEGPYLKGFFPEYHVKEYYNMPRQTFPETFIPTGVVDVVRTSTINNGSLHGDKMIGFKTDYVPNIDTFDDFDLAVEALDDKGFEPILQYLKNYE